MKTLLSFILAITLLTSCSKEREIEPINRQWVTFTASCKSCSIELMENGNTRTFHFGGWFSYTYPNSSAQTSTKATLYVPIDYPESQELFLQINESAFGLSTEKKQVIDSYVNGGREGGPYVLEVELNLRRD